MGDTSTFLRKITPKTVSEKSGINLLELPRPVQPQKLYDLFGVVTGAALKPGKDGMAPSIQFKGRFQAVTPDGLVFDAGVAFIPVMDSILYATVLDAQKEDAKAQVHIALSIGIVTAPSGKPSATGYEFDVQRLIAQEQSPTDPIAMLRAKAAEQAKQLAGPAAGTPAGGNAVAAASATAAAEPPKPAHKHKAA